MDSQVFISYRSSESEFALNIAGILNDARIPIWMDQLSGIQPGDDWVMALQTGVTNAKGMVCCISPAYVASKYCRRELARADTLGKPIIPLLLEAVSKEDWPIELQNEQYIDFREWDKSDIAFVELGGKLVSSVLDYMQIEANESERLLSPDVNKATELRALEDKIADADSELSFVDGLRKTHLGQQLDMFRRQFESISDAVLLSSDPMLTPKFEMQLERITVKIQDIQIEIDNLST